MDSFEHHLMDLASASGSKKVDVKGKPTCGC